MVLHRSAMTELILIELGIYLLSWKIGRAFYVAY